MTRRTFRLPGGIFFPAGLTLSLTAATVLTMPLLANMTGHQQDDQFAMTAIEACAPENEECATQWVFDNLSTIEIVRGSFADVIEQGQTDQIIPETDK